MNSLNIRPYLFGVGNTTAPAPTATATTATATATTKGTTATGTGSNSSWLPFSTSSVTRSFSNAWSPSTGNSTQWKESIRRISVYLFAVLLVVLILLLFIHFFVRPVFRWRPGAPGWIPLPGWDDGILFWKDGVTGPLPNSSLPIQNHFFDYTLQIDFFIQNPLQFATRPRLLLTRGAILKSPPSGDTLLGVLDQYNFAIALKPDTNDMIVSVLNKDNHMETAILPNIPVQEPFRLTVVVMEKAMETYLNGQLVRTTAFQAPPRDVKGDIFPASGAEANIVRYRNLKLWSRVLTTPEIRSSTPNLPSATDMGGGPIPTTSECALPTASH